MTENWGHQADHRPLSSRRGSDQKTAGTHWNSFPRSVAGRKKLEIVEAWVGQVVQQVGAAASLPSKSQGVTVLPEQGPAGTDILRFM
jgi:hypothetical protein